MCAGNIGEPVVDEKTRKAYELKAEVMKGLAHPLRVAIADFLSHGEQCVCDIAEHVGARLSNVSRHLAVMLRAGIVSSRKDGLKVHYSLRTPCVKKFLSYAATVLREQLKDRNAILQEP